MPPSPENIKIYEQVENEERKCQEKMKLQGDTRIKYCENEMFDKTALVTRFSA